MKKTFKTPFAVTVGAAVIASFAATAAQAEANPFGMTELSSGYMQVAELNAVPLCPVWQLAKPQKALVPALPPQPNPLKLKKPAAAKPNAAPWWKMAKWKKAWKKSAALWWKAKKARAEQVLRAQQRQAPKALKANVVMPAVKAWKPGTDAKAKEGACGAKMQGCGEGMQGCAEMMKGKDGSCGANMKAPAAAAPAAPAAAPAAPATK